MPHRRSRAASHNLQQLVVCCARRILGLIPVVLAPRPPCSAEQMWQVQVSCCSSVWPSLALALKLVQQVAQSGAERREVVP